MTPPRNHRVVVFGASRCRPGDEQWAQAETLGRLIATSGWQVVTGGYGGAMEAASEGAVKAGGGATGVLCKAFRSAGNPHLTEQVISEDLYERLRLLIETGDAYLVMPGSTGTLVELAMVWEMMNKNFGPPRPLICVGDFWRPVVELLAAESSFDPRFAQSGKPDRIGDFIYFAPAPQAAVERLAQLWAESPPHFLPPPDPDPLAHPSADRLNQLPPRTPTTPPTPQFPTPDFSPSTPPPRLQKKFTPLHFPCL